MEYKKFDNTIVARIDKGEEILDKIKEIHNILGMLQKYPNILSLFVFLVTYQLHK